MLSNVNNNQEINATHEINNNNDINEKIKNSVELPLLIFRLNTEKSTKLF